MIEEDEVNAPELVPAQSRARKKARKDKNTNANINPVGARKPRRPKQALPLQTGCQSILNFFKAAITNDFDKEIW